jgi:hypothetical protein
MILERTIPGGCPTGYQACGLPKPALRGSAQTPNVVIQWNQTRQPLFVGTGPGLHPGALRMMHIAMFDATIRLRTPTRYCGEIALMAIGIGANTTRFHGR